MDRSQDGPDHGACDRYLGKLESDGVGVVHDAGPKVAASQFYIQMGPGHAAHVVGIGEMFKKKYPEHTLELAAQ